MPYKSIDELPDSVKGSTSKHEQEIFLAAFNSAWEGTCKERDDKEECAFKIAWSAVKKNKEAEPSVTPMRMLNVLMDDQSQFVDIDGGLLVKDVVLLASGVWTDSNVRTPLFYPPKTLQKDAGNWKVKSLWVRHAGKSPRSVTDKVGSVKSTRYDGAREAIMGDLWLHKRTQTSKDAAEMVRSGFINAVSVEHGGEESYNATAHRMEAKSIEFYGLALVDQGACEVCTIRHDESGKEVVMSTSGTNLSTSGSTNMWIDPINTFTTPTPTITITTDGTGTQNVPINGSEKDMDESTKKVLDDLSVRIKALEEALPKLPKELEAKPPEPIKEAEKPKEEPKPDPMAGKVAELEKALATANEKIKALENEPKLMGKIEKDESQERDNERLAKAKKLPRITGSEIIIE